MLGIKENVVIFHTTLLQVSRLKENAIFMISSFCSNTSKRLKNILIIFFFVIIVIYMVINKIYYIVTDGIE